MNAKKCDACKRYYDNYRSKEANDVVFDGIRLLSTDLKGDKISYGTLDLCYDCMSNILQMFNMSNGKIKYDSQ